MIRTIPLVLLLLCILLPGTSGAEQFAVNGPRAVGMGGAAVAAVNDSTAIYWNPAALARDTRVDIRIPASVALRDHMGLKDTWTEVNDIYNQVLAGDPVAITRMISLLNSLDKPATGADLDATGGLYIAFPVSSMAMGISVQGLAAAGLYPTVDTLNMQSAPASPNFVGNNNTAVTGIGIATYGPGLAFASPVGETFFVGMNARMVYASTYLNAGYIQTMDFNDFRDKLDNSETKASSSTVDIGILYRPVPSFSLGITGRDLTSPAFAVRGIKADKLANGDVQAALGASTIELKPKARAGIAWNPYPSLTLALDYDLTKNETLTPGFEDQTLAVGLEQTIFSEVLSLRLGAYKNQAASSANTVYTAGLGLRIFALRLDVAGGYDSAEREYQAGANLALRF